MELNKKLFKERIEKIKNMLNEIEYWVDNADEQGHLKQKDYYNYITYDLSDISVLSQELFKHIEEAKKQHSKEPEEKEPETKKKKDKK